MRILVSLLMYLIFIAAGFAQSGEKRALDESLKSAIHDIIELAIDQNVSEIDKKYVHSEFGVYDLFRIGVPDTFKQYHSIAFAFPTAKHSSVYPNLAEITETATAPELTHYNAVFDCNEMVWDREGFFVTDSISYPKISEVIKQPVFDTSEFPESLYIQSKHIEENSYRVVLTERDIVFYLTKIDLGWYLTLFDRVTTDCSA